MKHNVLFILSFCMGYVSFGQLDKSKDVPLKEPIPLTIFLAPLLDGAAFGAEWKLNNQVALNMYYLKRKSDNSIFYNTKVNENLTELMFKVYISKSQVKKFKTFFAPTIGFRDIVYDQNFNRFFGFGGVFIDEFGFGNPEQIDVKANAKYFVPMYFGFDFNTYRGLIFECAAGISYQTSSGQTSLRGPIFAPYAEGINFRSRFLFGYKF